MIRATELTRLCGHRCPQHPRGVTGGFPSNRCPGPLPLSAGPRASVWAVSTRGSVTSWTSFLAPFPRTRPGTQQGAQPFCPNVTILYLSLQTGIYRWSKVELWPKKKSERCLQIFII